MHFPTQTFTLCALPTIFNPHDLQHFHYPQFFTPSELVIRDMFRAACHFSNTVVVGSEWIKKDVVRQFGVSSDKVQVIPWTRRRHSIRRLILRKSRTLNATSLYQPHMRSTQR